MKNLFMAFFFLALLGCTSNEQTLLFECNEQHQGEACNKLGKARSGEEALRVLKYACDRENTHACALYAERKAGLK